MAMTAGARETELRVAEEPGDPGPAGEGALELARRAGLSFTVADALYRRGSRAGEPLERWLEPRLAHLTPPHAMVDLEPAADRIARAVRAGERIAVFGDYDCDGITACAIVTEVLRALGGQVTPLLASRFAGGYGFSGAALERVRATGASLLVTCDCGSSDHARLEDARRTGIDAVVIDHHLVPEEALPALAFLNPHRPDCGFAYKGLASCGLALVVATALRRQLGADLDLRRWLDLVAVGTVADVAPLTDDNRALVRAGLRLLERGARSGLRALAIHGAGGRKLPVSAEDVAFQVAPRLNAPGRLGDPMVALELLLERDAGRAWELAARVDETSLRRREMQRIHTAEALADIEACGFDRDPALVLGSDRWHPGIVGIIAGRLADRLGKPTVVVALEGASGRGSARAPAGFRLYDALAACREALLGFGGHQAAAGLEVRADALARFRDAFNQACAQQLAGMAPRAPRWLPDVRLDERDDLAALLDDLQRLEPCGEANPAPRILVTEAEVKSARALGEHLKLELVWRRQRLPAFAPAMAEHEPACAGTIAVVGRLKRDFYSGAPAELMVEWLPRPS
jgi:single-stranded-DNA-specific exonuclease